MIQDVVQISMYIEPRARHYAAQQTLNAAVEFWDSRTIQYRFSRCREVGTQRDDNNYPYPPKYPSSGSLRAPKGLQFLNSRSVGG